KRNFWQHPNFDKINAATLKNLSQSLTFVSFARQLLQVGRAAQRTGSSLRFNHIKSWSILFP
ncbi:MAG: hypothetical protein ACKPB7_28475, partial [Sphaerospermopsis kisseleviana]